MSRRYAPLRRSDVDRAFAEAAQAVRQERLRERLNRPQRCEAHARRGTGTGSCDAPLDEHGACPRAADHIEV